MSEREGTRSKPTGRRHDKAGANQRTIPNSAPGPSSKRHRAADKPSITLGNVRNRDTHEGTAKPRPKATVEEVPDEDDPPAGPSRKGATVLHRGNTGQVGRPGTPLTQVLAASLAAGTSVDDIPASITQIIVGGNGGNGGNGVDQGIGGIGGVGQGPSLQIDRFSGTQIIILGLDAGGQVNQELDRILRLPVPRGVSDYLFWVMDPEGGYIPVSLRYCRNYQDLDKHIKTSLSCSRRAGGSYVERGDYSIVSEDGSFIVPVEFAQTVKAYMLLEISILQRQVKSRSDTIQNTTCPDCGTPATATGNGWFKCITCMRNYRMDEQDHDMEEIRSPQLVQLNEEAERKLFRRVHICIYWQQESRFSPPRLIPQPRGPWAPSSLHQPPPWAPSSLQQPLPWQERPFFPDRDDRRAFRLPQQEFRPFQLWPDDRRDRRAFRLPQFRPPFFPDRDDRRAYRLPQQEFRRAQLWPEEFRQEEFRQQEYR